MTNRSNVSWQATATLDSSAASPRPGEVFGAVVNAGRASASVAITRANTTTASRVVMDLGDIADQIHHTPANRTSVHSGLGLEGAGRVKGHDRTLVPLPTRTGACPARAS